MNSHNICTGGLHQTSWLCFVVLDLSLKTYCHRYLGVVVELRSKCTLLFLITVLLYNHSPWDKIYVCIYCIILMRLFNSLIIDLVESLAG